jgi:putative ABC transport system permease protein
MDVGTPWTGEIVGVVGSFRDRNIAEEPRREIFTVLNQTTIAGQTLVVRAAGDPAGLAAAVRGAMASVDPEVPVYNLQTMQEQVNRSLAQPRLRGALMGVFSAVALVLASLGIYGVIACTVAERRQEFGIRMALGARHGEIWRMVVLQGLKLTMVGLVSGLVAALFTMRMLRSFLFGVGPGDPVTLVATATLFLVVAFTASYLPARRATRLDPLRVLREE